jgi:hypothetical protein
MARQFGKEGVEVGAMHRFDCVADAAVKLPPAGNAQFVIEGHADQVVRELVAARGYLLDDVRRYRLVERF